MEEDSKELKKKVSVKQIRVSSLLQDATVIARNAVPFAVSREKFIRIYTRGSGQWIRVIRDKVLIGARLFPIVVSSEFARGSSASEPSNETGACGASTSGYVRENIYIYIHTHVCALTFIEINRNKQLSMGKKHSCPSFLDLSPFLPLRVVRVTDRDSSAATMCNTE